MPFFEGIKRNVVVLGLVSGLTDVSSEMIFPLLPLFLTSVLGASAAALPASAIAGALWALFSPAAAFAWGAAVSIIALIVLAFCFTKN
jgi:cytochrome c biogenesis protein CcdA